MPRTSARPAGCERGLGLQRRYEQVQGGYVTGGAEVVQTGAAHGLGP
ncbi:hypothetical protein [Streptomyces showdoensis]